ncbi:hypothetical protein [Paenibacillus ginsengarvi]|uniref:Uncharacterized protein n=1 Tax=Paenibacillus ginsengarvi TaxID=400777 RepID=A0A3B0CHX3_9BACL|nr:hypothetical protein [Paenibacillus ginsengarvi]RKN84983.1 hypothetical protein D7M11_10690 [Paenibacillus ginsengarvi]
MKRGLDDRMTRRKLLTLGAAGAAAVTGAWIGGSDSALGSGGVANSVYGNGSGNGNATGIRRVAEEVVQEYAVGVTAQLAKRAMFADHVAAMKIMDDLEEGGVVVTLGYYERGDGGGGAYSISAAMAGAAEDGGSVHNLQNGLQAKLIVKDNTIDLKQFGGRESIPDNVPYIQKGLNYLDSLNGGYLIIPQGTFHVVAKNRTIILKSNVTVRGVHRDLSILKIHGSTGNWGELFTHPVPNKVLRNIAFKQLTLDCNVDNAVTSSAAWTSHRTFFNGGEGFNYILENLKVIANGVWVFRGDVNNSTFRDCEIVYDFDRFPLGWFDISALWIAGENNHIANNLFYSRNRTTFTPETCIEFQGHNSHCNDNICLGFTNGILVTPSTSYDNNLLVLEPGGRGCKVCNNTIESSNKGIFLWPMNLPEGHFGPVTIAGNSIVINDMQQGHAEPNAGIDVKLQTPTWVQTTPIRNVTIHDNYIEYRTRSVSDSLYSGDAGIKFYINVEATGLDIRHNTIVNCGGNGIALHVDTGSTSWIRQVALTGNVFKNTKLPIWVNRNVSRVLIQGNLFQQYELYTAEPDNMKQTIKTLNNSHTSNADYQIKDNEISCAPGVKPYYPIYDLSDIDNNSGYKLSRGMVLEQNTPGSSMLLEPPPSPGVTTTVAKGQYIRRLDGKLYKTKFNYPSTIGSLKAGDGTTNVTIVRWISSSKLEVSDASNMKPNEALALDWRNLFKSAVFYVQAVTGNVIETYAGQGALRQDGVTPEQVAGSVLGYYTDLVEV